MQSYMHNQLLPRLVSQLVSMYGWAPKGTSFQINEEGRVCNLQTEMHEPEELERRLQEDLDGMDYEVLDPETHYIDLNARIFKYIVLEVVTSDKTHVHFRRRVDFAGLQRYLYDCGFDKAEQEPVQKRGRVVVDLTGDE